MYDEYRVTVQVEPVAWDAELEARLNEALPKAEFSQSSFKDDGDAELVYAYTASEDEARHVLEQLPLLLNAEGFTVNDAHLDRWNPGAGRWQHPSLPVSEARNDEEQGNLLAQLDTAEWEVRAHAPSGEELHYVRDELTAEGYLCIGTGWRRFSVLADDSGEALELADRIRLELPVGSETSPRRLSGRRRWFLRELMGQNYGSGGGG